jgi:hypothetical protein
MSAPTENVNGLTKLSADQDDQLIRNGYEPVPISDPSISQSGAGKAPFIQGWREGVITSERIAAMRAEHPDHPGTGLRSGHLVGIDVDVINQDHAAAIAKCAFDMFGETVLGRAGAKGVMLCYRNETPCGKITVAPLDKTKLDKVEILGTGQQFVAYGIHPKTNKPYRWLDQDFDPLSVSLAQLPAVTPAQLQAFAVKVAAKFLELGYGEAAITGDTGKERAAPSNSIGEPITEAAVREIYSWLDPDEERDEWRDNIAAIRSANIPGDDDLKIRRQIAHEYSRGELDRSGRYKDAQPSRYTDAAAVDLVFDTMPPTAGGIGIGTAIKAAQAKGWQGNPHQGQDPQKAFADANVKSEETKSESAEQAGGETDHDDATPEYNIFELWQLKGRMPPAYLVDGILMTKRIQMIFGLSEAHKTFLAVDLAMSIAYGLPAFGHFAVQEPGDVVYCADEDYDDVTQVRAAAWGTAKGINVWLERPLRPDNQTAPGRVFWIDRCPRIVAQTDVAKLINHLCGRTPAGVKPKLIIIDTKAKAMIGMNEDSAKDTGLLFHAMSELRRAFGCAVLLLAHPKKDEPGVLRGSSAQVNDGDGIWLAERNNDFVTMTCVRWKAGPKPENFLLRSTAYDSGAVHRDGSHIMAPVYIKNDGKAPLQVIDQRMTPKKKKAELHRFDVAKRRKELDEIYRERGYVDRHHCCPKKSELARVWAEKRLGSQPADGTDAAAEWEDQRNTLEVWIKNNIDTKDDTNRDCGMWGFYKNVSIGQASPVARYFFHPDYLALKTAEANGGAVLGDLPDEVTMLH